MKKLHVLIPSLVVTVGMPLIGLVGCGDPQPPTPPVPVPDVVLDQWDANFAGVGGILTASKQSYVQTKYLFAIEFQHKSDFLKNNPDCYCFQPSLDGQWPTAEGISCNVINIYINTVDNQLTAWEDYDISSTGCVSFFCAKSKVKGIKDGDTIYIDLLFNYDTTKDPFYLTLRPNK